MNPYMYIKIGPRIPIFWTVHGSIYADRSMNPYIKIGPWIPTFWPIRESLYSHRSVDLYIHRGPWIPIFLIGPWIPLFEAFGQLLNMTHHLILESIWLIPLSLSPHYHKYESYYMTHNPLTTLYMAILHVKIVWLSVATITTTFILELRLNIETLDQ